jgi:hypothetical protein
LNQFKEINFFQTFDCDPVSFDSTLKVLKNDGFDHLNESIPLTLELLDDVSQFIGKPIKATFFIRNISTNQAGEIVPESWKTFIGLWEEVFERGHGLGLHPHIDFPLMSQEDVNSKRFSTLLNDDFVALRNLGEAARITRIGGHSYNQIMAKLLGRNSIDLDSSAIPGRKLGKFRNASDWRNATNGLHHKWQYDIHSFTEPNSEFQLTQLPMTTIRSSSNPDYFRYLDYSFTSFQDFSFTQDILKLCGSYIVAISHPSTLLNDRYQRHLTLTFGKDHWFQNFISFWKKLGHVSENVDFKLLRDIL